MDELIAKTEEFLSAFRDSDLMRRYNDAKQALQCDAELSGRVGDYRLLSAKLKKNGLSFNDEKVLSHKYWRLMLNDTARAYFEAEKNLAAYLRGFSDKLEQSLADALLKGWNK